MANIIILHHYQSFGDENRPYSIYEVFLLFQPRLSYSSYSSCLVLLFLFMTLIMFLMNISDYSIMMCVREVK